MVHFSRTDVGNYATAVTLVAIATVLQAVALRVGGTDVPLVVYYPLLAWITWATSFKFGVLSVAASAVLAWILFLSDPAAYTASLSERLAHLGLFAVFGVLACALASAARHMQARTRARRERETAVRARSEAMLDALIQGVVASDAGGRVTYMNAVAADMAGCDRTAAMGRRVQDVLRLYDGQRRPVDTMLEAALAGEANDWPAPRWLYPSAGGEPLPVVEAAAPIRNAAGDVDGAVLLLRDARTEYAQGEASRVLRAIVDASPDVIIGVAADRRIVSWSLAAQALFGYDEHDALGLDAATLVAPRWRRRHPMPATLDAVHGSLGPVDVLFVGRDGRRFRATALASRVADMAGGAGGAGGADIADDPDGRASLSVALRDADAQRGRDRRAHRSLRGARDARRQADTSNRLKDELLATVSHELRTPLNVIYGWVEVLRNSGDRALQRQAIDAIDRSARSLSRMVGDILDASSLATGKLQIDSMPIDLVRIVADVTNSFRSAAADMDGVELVNDCSLDACIVSGDGERLRQMLSNLLSNAFKFTPSGGRVTVALARAGDQVRLTVADTGQGIPPEFLPHVFDAFRRANDSPASPRRGLGLGLSIVRHIAALHGGTVAVQSAGRDRGTSFTVTLPAGWHPVGAMAWAARQQNGNGGPVTLDARRILLVDDDATTRESLCAALETLGARVSVASSGREALAMVDDVRPDVVLSDLAMNDGDGFWLLRELRRRESGHDSMRVLAVTAHAARTDERHVLDADFDGYLCKPIDVKALARAIVGAKGE